MIERAPLAEVIPVYLLADKGNDTNKGYDSNAIRNRLKAHGIRPVISPKSTGETTIGCSKRIYRERNQIQHMIGHLTLSRAVATRYDKLAKSCLDTRHIATIRKGLHIATL
jgi:IS5 family transposase